MLGSIPRPELLERYRDADLFLFPSLRDSSGNVVLESLSRGLPVVCPDLGGPQHYVDEHCGIVVETGSRDRQSLEHAIAERISEVLADTQRLAAMSRAAHAHAERQSWPAVVANAYRVISGRLGWDARWR
jgi:glycosyltransferase involved in cell wall biosynthesis